MSNEFIIEETKTPPFNYYDLTKPMMRGAYLAEVIHIFPDWRELWTPQAAEQELEGFQWRGPGWYLTDTDSLLVIPSPLHGEYWFWVYNGRNPFDGINQMSRCPTRVDERGEESKMRFVRPKGQLKQQVIEAVRQMFKDHVCGQPAPQPRDIDAVLTPLFPEVE